MKLSKTDLPVALTVKTISSLFLMAKLYHFESSRLAIMITSWDLDSRDASCLDQFDEGLSCKV